MKDLVNQRWHQEGLQLTPGFTLIELLVTLAILGVLATITIPFVQVNVQRGHEQELRKALREIRNAIDAYKRASDEGRVAKPVGSTGYPKSLEILVEGVPDMRDPKHNKIYFLRRVPRDPFFVDESETSSSTWGKRSYVSEADDPQEGDDVYDVYSKSVRIGLNGVPYNQW